MARGSKAKRYVIIGASAAGLSALNAVRKSDPAGKITLISGEPHLPYSKVLLTYLIGRTADEKTLFLESKASLREKGIRPLFGKRAVQVNPAKREVMLDGAKVVGYDALLIASGASPVIPPFKGAKREFVTGVRDLEDVRTIQGADDGGLPVVIVGGGLVGFQTANALCRTGRRATVVISSPQILSQILDRREADFLMKRVEREVLEIILNEDVEELLFSRTGLKGVKLRSGRRVETRLLVVGKGVKPNVGFLEGSGVEVDWGVLVDDRMRTNVPDIYAAGDVAISVDYVTGERKSSGIWPAAVDQGEAAGHNMAGTEKGYPGFLRMNISSFFGIPVFSAGIVKPKGDGYSVAYNVSDGALIKIVTKEGALAGVVTIGRFMDSGLLQSLIYRRTPMDGLERKVMEGSISLPDIERSLGGRWMSPAHRRP